MTATAVVKDRGGQKPWATVLSPGSSPCSSCGTQAPTAEKAAEQTTLGFASLLVPPAAFKAPWRSGSGGPRAGRANARPPRTTTADHGKPSLSQPGQDSGKGPRRPDTDTSPHRCPGFRAATLAQLPLVTWGQVDGGAGPGAWTALLRRCSRARAASRGEPGAGASRWKRPGQAVHEGQGSGVHVAPGGPVPLPQLPPAAERGRTARRHGSGGQTWTDRTEPRARRQSRAFVGVGRVRARTGLGASPLAGRDTEAWAVVTPPPRPQLDASSLRPLLQRPTHRAMPQRLT